MICNISYKIILKRRNTYKEDMSFFSSTVMAPEITVTVSYKQRFQSGRHRRNCPHVMTSLRSTGGMLSVLPDVETSLKRDAVPHRSVISRRQLILGALPFISRQAG